MTRMSEVLKPLQVWQDSKNRVHKTEAEALRAETRYVVEELLKPVAMAARIVELDQIRGYNAETLQTIVDYFAQQLVEAQKRMGLILPEKPISIHTQLNGVCTPGCPRCAEAVSEMKSKLL